MGYILPVNRTQSADYHEREIKKERAGIKTDPVFKSVLDKKHEEIASNYNRLQLDPKGKYEKVAEIDSEEENIISEATGKGKHLNEHA